MGQQRMDTTTTMERKMNFEQAIVALKQGQRIRRGKDPWYYCMAGCAGGCILVKVYKDDGHPSSVILASDEVFSDDWKIFSGWEE